MLLQHQFIRFLLTGGFAAGVNIVSRYLFSFAIVFEVAVFLAYLCGMVTAFVLARLFVFEASGRSVQSDFYRFGVVNVFALFLTWGVSVGLARAIFPALDFTWYAEDVAHVIGVLVPAITSFVGHRYYSFRKR